MPYLTIVELGNTTRKVPRALGALLSRAERPFVYAHRHDSTYYRRQVPNAVIITLDDKQYQTHEEDYVTRSLADASADFVLLDLVWLPGDTFLDRVLLQRDVKEVILTMQTATALLAHDVIKRADEIWMVAGWRTHDVTPSQKVVKYDEDDVDLY
jgi:hypothetical protein